MKPDREIQLVDVVLGAYIIFLSIMVWKARAEAAAPTLLLFQLAVIFFLYFGCLQFLKKKEATLMLMDGFRSVVLIATIPFLFLSIGNIPEILNPKSYEAELQAIDVKMFGVDPVLWMEQFLHPLAVDWFQLAYISYYPLFLVGLVLFFNKRHHEFRIYIGALAITTLGTFVGYFFVPARSPYFAAQLPEFAHLFPFTEPIKGLWIGDFLAHALDTAESVKVDCFPSGHTAGAVLVILATRKWMPRLFWVVLPIASSLIFATVYLRYHYVIDLIAGAALAVGAFWVSGLVTDWLVRTRTDTVSTDPQEA